MEKKIVIVKLDVSGTMEQIRSVTDENSLFALSRKLRMYKDLGLISIPNVIREGLNKQLDRIYRDGC